MLDIRTCFMVIFSVLIHGVLWTQAPVEPLTKAQKLQDFDYLYQELKASYPYFGINKRVHKTDWLANRERYVKAISESEDDVAFFKALNTILNDLNNGHTDAYPTIIYNYFYEAYTYAVSQDSIYNAGLQELQKTSAERARYWEEINRRLFFPENTHSEATSENTPVNKGLSQNIETTFEAALSVAIIRINSFSYDLLEADVEILKAFFEKAFDYKNIVLDIQGNDGGSTEYWSQHMVPYLINQPINYKLNYGFKDSKRLRTFKPDYFKDRVSYDAIGLPNMPEELGDGSYLFRSENLKITPNSSRGQYTGTVYLLVDDAVFSSSEALAYFCKATHFATVVGETTAGDGVGTDPLLLTLPNSGIVIRFTGEMGLNPDGSANEETKTVPDIRINAEEALVRRQLLLDYIKTKE